VANGKVVLITGASHGIGASLVSAYSEAGYNVVANALSIESSSNPNIINVPGDIGKPHFRQTPCCGFDKSIMLHYLFWFKHTLLQIVP
jgi:short-subunit dehydrogenase involved in D-alanine esterification of teichoic acids